MSASRLHIKRVYDPPSAGDGLRVLVDRLWPRGLSKEKAHIDLWLRDISPTDPLRKEFHAQPEKWEHFVAAYRAELKKEPAKSAAAELLAQAAKRKVTLLFAAHDEEHNNAVALRDLLNA
ncbi:MAG: hypothetical protein BGP06_11890 [Rhizobiales bacterium 65-9]|mgnify:CR=1 FL=1|nr:DUF488 family protein [Hyphomicrobiales bacterium]OJY33976.1 MAG: hypothetical protein BGP06_11890 [Rhizobiales bacterium 65-9]